MHPGDVIAGRFEIIERAGKGGMGEVYRALDRTTAQPAAIKIITSQREKDASRFAREARILSDLVHPRIVGYLSDGALASGEPYLAMEWLEATVDELRREASRHGGHLEPLLDGSMAVMLSSAGVATDLAAQAARCALALRALAADRAMALALGRGATTDRQPVGPALDRAARIVEVAADAGVVLDEVIAGLLDARFDVRETAQGFALHGERELSEGTRRLLGKATPCVGRDRELRILEQLFEASVEEGEARAALVTAPAGVGKSRLCQELLRGVQGRGEQAVSVWIGRGDPLRAGSAFGLLGQPLRRTCGILDGEPLATRRDKLRARVDARVAEGERRRVTEFLGEIIGTPFPDDESLPLRSARKDAQLMNDQMRAAFLDFLAAELAAGPVLVVLEDLHWGDRPTVHFLDRALRDLGERSLFILALARPEVHDSFPGLWQGRHVQEIWLRELSRKAIERLTRHVLGEGVSREVLERLARLSEGNAFYLEELIRWAAEGRSADLPETVVAMVQSRLGALNDEARRALRAASIFGEVFWSGGVVSLLGGTRRAGWMVERLGELIEREVVVKRPESRFPGEDEYAFRHALLREGAYAMLTEEDRALGHRLAGEWLEQRGEQDALVLAEHFEKGGDRTRAGQCCLRAAEQALWGGDSMAAMACARRGIECEVPEDLRIGLLGILCESSMWQVEVAAGSLAYADELARIAGQGSAPWARAMLVRLYAAIHAGRIDDFSLMLHTLREVEPAPDASGPFALGLTTGAYVLDLLARIAEASMVVDRMALISQRAIDGNPIPQFMAYMICGMRDACAKADPWSALHHCRLASAMNDVMGSVRYRSGAQWFTAMNLWFLGMSAEAEQTLKGTTLPDQELGFGSSTRPFILAWVLAGRGALDEARGWALRLIANGQSRRLPLDEGRGHWAHSEVLLRAGELDAAETEIEGALAVLGLVSPLDYPGALATLAALRLAQGRPVEALAAAQEGTVKAEAIGACSFFFRDAFLHLTHAECLEATGNHAAACAAIAKAKAWILDVADKIGDPAYRRSYLENVPENRKTLDLARAWLGEGGSI